MAEYDAQADPEMLSDSEVSTTRSRMEDEDLRAGLTGLAGMVTGSFGLEAALAQVAGFATHAIPGADGAGVTLVRPENGATKIQTWSVTAEFVREIDVLQYEILQEGPCITCMQTGRTVMSGSLDGDERWRRFGHRAARLGVHSSLSLPLLVQDEVVGAINSYARQPDAFTEHAVRLGEQFAGPAAVAVHNAQLLAAARTTAEQLQTALTSRTVIDQAIGILRSRSGGSAEEAFARLKQISQSENVKLAVVAQRLVEEAVRRAHARHASS